MNLKPFCILSLIFLPFIAFAQAKNKNSSRPDYQFGDIKPTDFHPKSPVIDSSSDAVVLADVGSTDFEGNNNGYFNLVFKIHERILIRNRNAYDAATIQIHLYSGRTQYEDKFNDLEAATYNLENGQVVQTKLDKTALFKEKINKDYQELKFTLPNIKEGCIVEYQYTIKSPFDNNDIRTWYFQSKYPVLWSEYKVTIPPFYTYVTIPEGYLHFAFDSTWSSFHEYRILDPGDETTSSNVYAFSGNARSGWWVVKDAPPFKDEKYMRNADDYISKIVFQLHSVKYNDNDIKLVVKDWFTTASDLMKRENFGQALSNSNGWMESDLKTITAGTQGLEKAKKIYEYVRDHFDCDGEQTKYTSNSLKKVYQNRKGNVADINFMLMAMLANQGFDVHPVILSTEGNGIPSEVSAFLYQYDYVICQLKIGSETYLLDATDKRIGFGRLPLKCYNGNGRLIDQMPLLLPLSRDSLSEEKSTLIFIANDEKEGLVGNVTKNFGYFESSEFREKHKEIKSSELTKEIAKEYSSDFRISNVSIDSAFNYEMPVTVHEEIHFKFDDDIVYFNPMLNHSLKLNPFAVANRIYPVNMPYKIFDVYLLNMEVPKGYKIDELPKSARVKLNENEGMFEYMVAGNEKTLQIRVKLLINKTDFQPEDYQTLRDFYSYIVKKEAEQIVFKKIN